MNLREQLANLLPEILPVDSDDAIKGTQLIELVKNRLNQSYSTATLRYHFSILTRDPTSTIAKVDGGQGYYLRTTRNRLEGAGEVVKLTQALLMEESTGDIEKGLARMAKLRVLASRYAEKNKITPALFHYEYSSGGNMKEFLWKYPDASFVEWDLPHQNDSDTKISETGKLKHQLGKSPFTLSAVKFFIDAESNDFREAFFHCLSNSKWAHRGEMIIAEKIDDEVILETLQLLGNEHGIRITSLGLSLQQMDEWPSASKMAQFKGPELEALLGAINPEVITHGTTRPSLDWKVLSELEEENENFQKLLVWLNTISKNQVVSPYPENLELGEIRT